MLVCRIVSAGWDLGGKHTKEVFELQHYVAVMHRGILSVR